MGKEGRKYMENDKQDMIIYNSPDGKTSVALYAKDGNVWMSQNQIAELFATSSKALLWMTRD